MFRRKNTEIVLSQKNLSALLFAHEVVRACFGEEISFRHATIRSKEEGRYKVSVVASLLAANEKFGRPLGDSVGFVAEIEFTIVDDYSKLYFAPEVVGEAKLEMKNGIRFKDEVPLMLNRQNKVWTLTPESQSTLNELFGRLK